MGIKSLSDRLWHDRLGRPYKLNYMTYGSGEAPLLLIHGLGSSHRVWTPLIKLVGDKWKIIAPDLLGFGESPTPDWNDYDVRQHAKHVMALLRRFHIDQPLTIVGHSMGCLIATHIAYHYPSRVKKLILFEPPLFADIPEYKAHQRARLRYFAMFGYIATHPELAFKKGELRKGFAKISGISLRPQTWLPFQRSLRNTIMSQQAYDELHALRVPTIIVHGRLDVVVPRADVRKMLKKNPHINFQTVNRMHGVSARAARELAQLLEVKQVPKK